MRPIHRILLAIKDPRAKSHAALAKTAQLARALGAEVRLFHGIADPIYIDAAGSMAQVYPDFERDWRDWYLARLEKLAQRLRRRGVKTSTAVMWDFPICESIVREAARFEADLIVAECHPTAHHAPWLLRFNDWELLRLSPLPVLLVKSHRAYHRPAVLAALDPTHAFGKPADLDDEILRYAATVAEALHGPLHAVHAYEPAVPGAAPTRGRRAVPATRTKAQVLGWSGRTGADVRAANAVWRARSALQDVVRWNAIPDDRRHLVPLHPARAIEDTARRIGGGIVVMGALSRSGLSRLLIGNTAERVLDQLRCDVLVVKPRNFRNVVARQPRGVQMIALPA
jgi:universal stress protein E